jgi:hypothetical protein
MLGLYTTAPDWLREQDLNLRPLGYEPNELPGCSIPRRGDICYYTMLATDMQELFINFFSKCISHQNALYESETLQHDLDYHTHITTNLLPFALPNILLEIWCHIVLTSTPTVVTLFCSPLP